MRRPRIYLAGPEVFLPDPKAAGEAKRVLCAAMGFEGVFPLDAVLKLEGLDPAEKARTIGLADEELIHGCDLLIANLTPFRGVSGDIGTAYEAGYARALGKPVFGYTNVAADYRARAARFRVEKGAWPDFGDTKDVEMEDFGLAENLMLDTAIRASGGTLVRTTVAAGAELTDLTGFSRCLEQARAVLASARLGSS
jgi:nucleoside 2-deoxyribosyltransferase